ncbi:thiamine-phosphate kinase [Pelagicoccus mobilis]|uniref:Thiamine-monophosphate kinase n=1 Tax=Pelagicoccus mobilis TaxID=415221 RepID=A0A934S2H7_9BACT|nr:thiamine-phosphate kinase [Pelagicoccus mobilis]MBK1879990.1 thiamine-monophosphate kinase [Pelagicoccus mobilis]
MNPFSADPSLAIGSLGESALIEKLRTWLGASSPTSPFGIGDDCAVLPSVTPNSQQLVTADPIIYGKHFDDSVGPEQAAAKLLRRNLSDIAAMGGRPTHAVIALALSSNVSISWIESFYKGLALEAEQFSVSIVGGDVSSADGFLGAFLTLYGETLPQPRPLLRKNATPESPIFVTGELGGTRIKKHYSFTPRLAEGQWLAQSGVCTSCSDLSDGLGKDFANITPDGLVCVIDCEKVPVATDAESISKESQHSPLYHAFNDGEDFELIFTLSPDTNLDAFKLDWEANFDTPLSQIGVLREGESGLILANEPSNFSATGYEHLR